MLRSFISIKSQRSGAPETNKNFDCREYTKATDSPTDRSEAFTDGLHASLMGFHASLMAFAIIADGTTGSTDTDVQCFHRRNQKSGPLERVPVQTGNLETLWIL